MTKNNNTRSFSYDFPTYYDGATLDCIITDTAEEHKGWIEIHNGQSIKGLPTYKGEIGQDSPIFISYEENIPKYIYLKKL